MLEKLENYIFGKLNQDEIDELWIEFLKAPEWLDYLLTELQVREYFRKNTKKPR